MVSMKIIGILVCAILVVQSNGMSDEEKEMVMMVTKDCREANKVPDEEMKKAFEGEIPTSRNAKCAMACVMKQFNVMQPDKLELNVDNMMKMSQSKAKLDEKQLAIVKEILEKCKSPPAADECEFPVAVGECVEKEAKSRGLKKEDFMH